MPMQISRSVGRVQAMECLLVSCGARELYADNDWLM
jgi:hypothetical protein